MIIIALFLLLAYVLWLYKKSKNDYFSTEDVYKNWSILIEPLLYNFGFKKNRIKQILEAYLYFVDHQKDFDGATIVADIWQIRKLDIPAMAHDYEYIQAKNIKERLISDWQYAQDMRQFKVNWLTAYSRFALLVIINITGIYNIFKLFKK